MAGAVPLVSDESAITTIEELEVSPLSITGAGILCPRPRTKPTLNGRLGCSSQPGSQTSFLGSDRHPLSAVKDAFLFRDLSASEFAGIAGAGQERIFSHNQSLFGEGDPLRWVSIITSGHAKTIRYSSAGKLMILHISGPGEVLDGLGSSLGATHSAQARAVRHCRIFSWEVSQFESLTSRYPALGRNSIRLLLRRLRVLEGRVHELATDRVPQRLAKVLLRLILQTYGSARGRRIYLTGEDLAQMVATTQFTVSRLLCDWAAQGIIQPERTAILVENLPGLLAIAMQAECAA